MDNHEKLKWVCDKIGYKVKTTNDNNLGIKYSEANNGYPGEFYKKYTNQSDVDIREIIFTQEFIYKLKEYLHEVKNLKAEDIVKKTAGILYNLDNPIEYIYNLIKE